MYSIHMEYKYCKYVELLDTITALGFQETLSELGKKILTESLQFVH